MALTTASPPEPTRARILFGGSFDPPHRGHIALVNWAQQCFPTADIHLIPAAQVAHKNPLIANATQRLAMLQLCAPYWQKSAPLHQAHNHSFAAPTVLIDDCEIQRGANAISYTIETVTALRTRYPKIPLILMLGLDQYAAFDHWHASTQFVAQVNIWWIARPPWQLPAVAPRALQSFTTVPRQQLTQQSCGAMALDCELSLPHNSSAVRRGHTEFVVPEVARYIHQQSLYSAA